MRPPPPPPPMWTQHWVAGVIAALAAVGVVGFVERRLRERRSPLPKLSLSAMTRRLESSTGAASTAAATTIAVPTVAPTSSPAATHKLTPTSPTSAPLLPPATVPKPEPTLAAATPPTPTLAHVPVSIPEAVPVARPAVAPASVVAPTPTPTPASPTPAPVPARTAVPARDPVLTLEPTAEQALPAGERAGSSMGAAGFKGSTVGNTPFKRSTPTPDAGSVYPPVSAPSPPPAAPSPPPSTLVSATSPALSPSPTPPPAPAPSAPRGAVPPPPPLPHLASAEGKDGDPLKAVVVQDTPDRGKIIVSLRPIAAGEVVLRESPALAVDQAAAAPTVAELQMWLDAFAALDALTRSHVLKLYRPEQAAEGGALASLLGRRGERVVELLRPPAGVAPEEVWRLLQVVECNTFGVESRGGGCLTELLPRISRLNHSCLPNALRGPGTEDGVVEVRAIRAIGEGKEITISYIDEEALLSSTCERKERLRRRWQFDCGCERCLAEDALRVFRCPAGPACGPKGAVCVAAGGDGRIGLAPCCNCGRRPSVEAASERFEQEAKLREQAPVAVRAAVAAAGGLQVALEQRDGAAFEKAIEAAMTALTQCATAAALNKQVMPSHHLVVGIAKAAASVRAVLGDGLAAGKQRELAVDMWGRAAGELAEAMEAEKAVLPIPRDGRIGDLIGLSGIYQRMERKEEARKYLQEALDEMGAVYWACAPSRRGSSEMMQKGVEAALAAM